MQHKYVVDAAQTLGYSCNDYADEVKSKNFEARVHEEGALYLPAVLNLLEDFQETFQYLFLN